MATVDIEDEDVTLGTNAEAMEVASSELYSYEAIPLSQLTSDMVMTIAGSADIALVHRWSKQVGMMVMKFSNYFETYKPIVMSMKQKLCGLRGSQRKTVIDGQEMTWAEYCKVYYGCSYRWVAKLIDGE
jgi:hypothetical protein